MLANCKDCHNFKDEDKDGIGYCVMCNIFVLKEGKCEILPKLELDKIARRANMNNVANLVTSNYSQVSTTEG